MIWKIYKITGLNGCLYIGKTQQTVRRRWGQHQSDARGKRNWHSRLHNMIRKHGAEFFVVETLTECETAREAEVCERALIAAHGTYSRGGDSLGLNLTIGGEGVAGHRHSPETLARLSAISTQNQSSPEYRKQHSDLAKARGARFPAWAQAKVADMLRGVPKPPEWRAKISATLTGRKLDPEHARRSRELVCAMSADPVRVAARAKKAAATLKGKKKTAAHCAALGRAHAARWAQRRADNPEAFTKCRRGHPLSGDNLLVLVNKDGGSHPRCRACSHAAYKRRREAMSISELASYRERGAARGRAFRAALKKECVL